MKFLEELLEGIEDKEEIIEKIKTNVAANYVPKADFNSKNEELKDVKDQLVDRDTQLKELKETAKGNEDLTKKIEELEALNETTKTEYEAKIATINKNMTIEKAIAKSELKPIDAELIKTLVDVEKVIINDDGITGLKEQLEKIKEERPFLFEKEVKEEKEIDGFKPGESSREPGIPEKPLSYTEMMKRMNK